MDLWLCKMDGLSFCVVLVDWLNFGLSCKANLM